MQTVTVTAKVNLPTIPPHLVLVDGQRLPLSAFTNQGLRDIGYAFGEQLIEAAEGRVALPAALAEPEALELTAEPIDLQVWPPAMSRIGEAGTNGHVAVALPAYGLMFDATPPKLAKNWEHAKQLASESRLLGFDDWRLPESHELALLIRHDRYKPAIDTEFFPHTPTNDWYWTNTVHASGSSYAWIVDFNYGYVYDFRQSNSGFVRAVRRVPASQ